MQTRVFAAHVRSIVEGLQLNDLKLLLERIYLSPQNVVIQEADKPAFAKIVFGIQAYLSTLTGDRREIAKNLGLTSLLNPTKLAQLLTAFQSAQNHHSIRQDLLFGDLYHSAQALLRLDSEIQSRLVSESFGESAANYTVLSFEIVDYEGDGIPIARLAAIVRSLDALYSALDQYLGTQSTPRIAYADSGSDINIGVTGLAETISVLSDVFLRAWDALRFRKNTRFERDLDTAIKGIQFLDSIHDGTKKGIVDRETAEQLEASIKIRLNDLISSGVMIEGTPTAETVDKRQVLLQARSQRLLIRGDGVGSDAAEGGELS